MEESQPTHFFRLSNGAVLGVRRRSLAFEFEKKRGVSFFTPPSPQIEAPFFPGSFLFRSQKKENKLSQHKGKWREDFLSTQHCPPQTKFNCVTLLTSHKDVFQKPKELNSKESRLQRVPGGSPHISPPVGELKAPHAPIPRRYQILEVKIAVVGRSRKNPEFAFIFPSGKMDRFFSSSNHLHKLHGLDLD